MMHRPALVRAEIRMNSRNWIIFHRMYSVAQQAEYQSPVEPLYRRLFAETDLNIERDEIMKNETQ